MANPLSPEDKWQLIERGGVLLLLVFLLATVMRGDWLPRTFYDQLNSEHTQQLDTCERSRSALEATLRAYTTRDVQR